MGSIFLWIDCKLSTVGFPLMGGKVSRLLKKECDPVGRHGKLIGFCRGRAGAVKDRDDDNQGNGIVSGKLGGIAVFGDTVERLRGCDGHSGASSFFGIKFELDFHCRQRWGTKGRII
jgi:hypothetical protein